MWLTLAFVSALVFLLYKYYEKKYRFWEERGIPTSPFKWILGSLYYRIRATALDYELERLRKYGKIYGSYNGTEPILVISDYELAKRILIKDFQHFNTRVNFKTYHKMWNENLVFSGFERWKRIRTIASSAFTTGKLRATHPLIQACVDKLVVYLDKVVDEENGNLSMTKQTIGGFTMDAIASAAFGTETNANDLRETPSPVVVNAQKLFLVPIVKATFAFTAPRWLLRLLGIEHFLDAKAFNFFIDFVRHIVKQRKAKLAHRNDFIQFLLDSEVDEKELENVDLEKLAAFDDNTEKTEEKTETKTQSRNLKRLTEDEIIAQSLIFLTAGFETTATTITHTIHELSLNPSIQEKIYNELTDVLSECDEYSVEYYEKIMTKTPFLEATIKEALRKYPPLSRLNRICNTQDYQLDDLKLDKGQQIEIMIVAMQRNPEYFPEPRVFRPERFLAENAKDLAFFPFGAGSRSCIGARFALQEMKTCLAKLIIRYKFQKPEGETDSTLQYRKATPFLNCYDFQTKVQLRDTSSVNEV